MRYRNCVSAVTIGYLLFSFAGCASSKSHSSAPDDSAQFVYNDSFNEEPVALNLRKQRIKAELEKLDTSKLPPDHWAHEWAGRYYVGDGLGQNCNYYLAPESGIVFTWFGCMGLYASNHGDITKAHDDGLTVRWANTPQKDEWMDWSDKRLYFVRWGERRYLIPEKNLDEVVDDYNRAGIQRMFMSYAAIKAGGPSRFTMPPEDPLQLPSPWRERLATGFLEAKITEVVRADPGSWRNVELILDRGLKDGIKVGTVVGSHDPEFLIFDVTEVWDTSCRVLGSRDLGSEYSDPTPQIGETMLLAITD